MSHEESAPIWKKGGFSAMVKGIIASDHTGSHTDAYTHMDTRPGAESIDQLPLDLFMTEAVCIDCSHVPPRQFITVDHLRDGLKKAGFTLKRGDTFLYHTGHYERHYHDRNKWWTEFAGLDAPAMHFLADAGVVNVGTEAFSIDNPASTLPDADPPYPAHQVCRDRKILNTENLIIPLELSGRRFTYIGFPIKIVGATGGWIRAVAVLDD
jgi:kynurenine formamidase